jgi:hypothetical protein
VLTWGPFWKNDPPSPLCVMLDRLL